MGYKHYWGELACYGLSFLDLAKQGWQSKKFVYRGSRYEGFTFWGVECSTFKGSLGSSSYKWLGLGFVPVELGFSLVDGIPSLRWVVWLDDLKMRKVGDCSLA